MTKKKTVEELLATPIDELTKENEELMIKLLNNVVIHSPSQTNQSNAYTVEYVIKDIIKDVIEITRPRRMSSSMKRNLNKYNYRKHLQAIMSLIDNPIEEKPNCPRCKGSGQISNWVRDLGDGLTDRPYKCTYCKGTGDLY